MAIDPLAQAAGGADVRTLQPRRQVLLLVNEEAHIGELARVAALLLRETDLQPVVYMEDRLAALGKPGIFTDLGLEVLGCADFPDDAASRGAEALGAPGRSRSRILAQALVSTTRLLLARLPERLRRYLKFKYLLDLDYVDLHREIMLRRAARAEAALTRAPHAALVMCEDNVELDTAIWIQVARRRGIRSVILPYTISNTAEFAESYVRHAPSQVGASWQNRFTATLFPRWELRYKGSRILRVAYAKVVANEMLGLAPPEPWLLNSGSIDAIAAESVAMRQYYLAAGIPDVQLVMTGSLTDDIIARARDERVARTEALVQELGLVAGQPILLVALPPDQNTYDRPNCEFSDFNDLIDFWGQTLAAVRGWNVIVRPHPKTRPEKTLALKAHGVAISYADTAELVPLCDLYVASVSATIRWAIACGKPVVNYDVYQYGYRDYENIPGVALVTTRKAFTELIERLTSDPAMVLEMASEQERIAPTWAKLDGGSGRRLAELISGGMQK